MFCPVNMVSATLILVLSLAPVMASDPGLAAMDFLGKVREGNVDLEPGADTALLEHITERKRESIRKRIERLEDELKGGELELGEVKEDGGYAAAMIRKTGGFDSAGMQVFPVALVKRGDRWLPAPVPASFENAVAGYTLPLKARLAALESWMMRKRVTDLERLLAESTKRTRDRIRDSIIGEDLEGDDLGKITDRFLDACAEGDRAAILGFLGGLSDPLPSDWPARLKASKAAVGGEGNWRSLVSPDVIRVRVSEEVDRKDGRVSIAWLDPQRAGTSGVGLVHLSLSRDAAGQWMIDLPESLLYGRKDSDDEDFDGDLRARFAEKLREADSAAPEKTAREAAAALLVALNSGGVRETLRKVDAGNQSRFGSIAFTQAADVWWSLNEPGAFRVPVELGFKREGSLAAVAYQWFSVGEPDRFAPRTLFFRQTEGGWLWCPGVVPKDAKKDHASLSKWAEEMEAEWRLSWRESLMSPSVRLEEIVFGEPPSDDEVRTLIGEWLGALEKKDLSAALATAAWLGAGEMIPMRALRNISYDLANSGEGELELAAIHRTDSWVAATVRRDSGERTQNIFLPVVITPRGARLLPEIDLINEDTRTRNFLNKASFDRLGKNVGDEKLAELIALFEKSRQEVK
jgi:hypothetical protein